MALTKAQTNKLAALFSQMDENDLNHVVELHRHQRALLGAKAKKNFRPGQNVKFVGKNGIKVFGKITKINRKTIAVRAEGGTNWRVSPSLLEAV